MHFRSIYSLLQFVMKLEMHISEQFAKQMYVFTENLGVSNTFRHPYHCLKS